MNYDIHIEGFEGQKIEIQPAGMFSGYKLFINNELASKGPKRDQMILRKNDGTTTIAIWKPQVLGLDVPQLLVDGKIIKLVEPLKWYEHVWNGIPLLLFFNGGALGAITGMVGFSINTKIFRSSRSTVSKFALTAVISLVTIAAFIVAATLILGMIE